MVSGSVSSQPPEPENSVVTASEPIPFKQAPEPNGDTLHRVVWVALVAISIVIGVGIVLKRSLQNKGLIGSAVGKRILLSDTKRITPKVTVYLLNVDSQDYLMVQSGDQLQLIRHDRKEVASTPNAS